MLKNTENTQATAWLTQLTDSEMEIISGGGFVANSGYVNNCYSLLKQNQFNIQAVFNDFSGSTLTEINQSVKTAKQVYSQLSVADQTFVKNSLKPYMSMTFKGMTVATLLGC